MKLYKILIYFNRIIKKIRIIMKDEKNNGIIYEVK